MHELRCRFEHNQMKMKLQRQHVKNGKRKKFRIEASETLLLKTGRKLQRRLGSS